MYSTRFTLLVLLGTVCMQVKGLTLRREPTTAAAVAALSCRDIIIPISATTSNKVLPTTFSADTLNDTILWKDLYDNAASTQVSGQYSISARYCEPARSVNSRRNSLQVLVHGITETKDYWSGLAPPGTKPGQDTYSWALYAANRGYPTLAIDRLCSGNSSHPNSVLNCQIFTQTEVLHQIIQSARSGTLPGIGRPFNTILYIGHSYGSIVGNLLSVLHPTDSDTYVLTGYTQRLINGAAGIFIRPLSLPAAIVFPQRFGYLILDPLYVTETSEAGTRQLIYAGNFDEAVFQYDFANRGTVTLGEIATALGGQISAPGYTGPVFVLNGNEDFLFCQSTQLQSVIGFPPPNCSLPEFSAAVRDAYPNARIFGFFNQPQCGHNVNLHRSAQDSFRRAHQFLADAGF